MDLIPLSTIRPDTVHWLWPNHLPQGKLAILDGDPGTGKSLITLDICARLSLGDPFPDGAPSPGFSSVIILNAEDAIADTVLPRLTRLGADMSKIYTIGTAGLPAFGTFSLPGHIRHLRNAVATSQARLVIIDPIMAFLDRSIATASDQSVRAVLTPLARLAQDHACTILMVRHLTKSNRHAIYRGGGSIGILGACRSAWLTGRDPNDTGRFILAQIKNNLASVVPALAYTMSPLPQSDQQTRATSPCDQQTVTMPSSGGEDRGKGELVSRPTLHAPRSTNELLSRSPHDAPLTWLGPCDITANDILGPRVPLPPRALTRQLLEDLLADGPLPFPEIACKIPGTNHSALFRARNDLKISSIRVRQNGTIFSYWLLPGQTLPAHILTEDIICDPDDILGPARGVTGQVEEPIG
jgi:hypothetical protein